MQMGSSAGTEETAEATAEATLITKALAAMVLLSSSSVEAGGVPAVFSRGRAVADPVPDVRAIRTGAGGDVLRAQRLGAFDTTAEDEFLGDLRELDLALLRELLRSGRLDLPGELEEVCEDCDRGGNGLSADEEACALRGALE